MTRWLVIISLDYDLCLLLQTTQIRDPLITLRLFNHLLLFLRWWWFFTLNFLLCHLLKSFSSTELLYKLFTFLDLLVKGNHVILECVMVLEQFPKRVSLFDHHEFLNVPVVFQELDVIAYMIDPLVVVVVYLRVFQSYLIFKIVNQCLNLLLRQGLEEGVL